MNNIFISTGGVINQPAIDTAKQFYHHEIRAVELSGGVFLDNQVDEIISLSNDYKFQIHNYFPPPKIPFVFNLATSDRVLLKRSMEHVRSAMKLSVAVGRPVYSFHAGFRINPKISELGMPLSESILRDYHSAFEQFVDSVLILAEEAKMQGVTLLIENNVLSKVNLERFSENPLLLTTPDEICSFMDRMPGNVGLLLDLAHLKVSGKSLGFDLVEAHEALRKWIKGYHLSDNDGTEDSNLPISEDSWFWEVINPTLDYYSLEVYRVEIDELVNQYHLVKNKLIELGSRIKGDK